MIVDITTSFIESWIVQNRYCVEKNMQFVSRCIDGRYPHQVGLAPVALPGADVGQMAIVVAASRTFGLELDKQKTFEVIEAIDGGLQNVHDHTDDLHEANQYCAGCGHIGLLIHDPVRYGLEASDMSSILELFAHDVKPDMLHGAHHESAIVYLDGAVNWSIYSQDESLSAFVVTRSLVNGRHRSLAQSLIDSGAILTTPQEPELEAETLYDFLSDTFDDHVLATLSHLAPTLPQFEIHIHDNGSVQVQDLGSIENT